MSSFNKVEYERAIIICQKWANDFHPETCGGYCLLDTLESITEDYHPSFCIDETPIGNLLCEVEGEDLLALMKVLFVHIKNPNFTLKCGKYKGKTLLQGVIATGNEELVQLLTASTHGSKWREPLIIDYDSMKRLEQKGMESSLTLSTLISELEVECNSAPPALPKPSPIADLTLSALISEIFPDYRPSSTVESESNSMGLSSSMSAPKLSSSISTSQLSSSTPTIASDLVSSVTPSEPMELELVSSMASSVGLGLISFKSKSETHSELSSSVNPSEPLAAVPPSEIESILLQSITLPMPESMPASSVPAVLSASVSTVAPALYLH